MKTIYLVPHSHYDAEVFLTREEYLQWGFSNLLEALKLLETEPDFRFTLDQVCYIEPFMERYPECRESVLRFIREKRLYIAGGMYAMADMNMPSGESLARQYLRSVAYCRDTLGVDISLGWTLDSFGYSPQTPQIMSRCGFRYHAFARGAGPHTADFIWVAPDGSETLCHHMKLGYGGIGMGETQEEFDQRVLRHAKILSKYSATDALMMTEGGDLSAPDPIIISRVKGFNSTHTDVQIRIATAIEYFEELEKVRPKLERIHEDLNPIFQGCYTSRIEVKKGNRRLEGKLTSAEALAASSGYPLSPDMKTAWDNVLFNQFHDDICGCHVDKVFQLIMRRYTQSEEIAENLSQLAGERLAASADTSGDGIPVLVFNPLGWERKEVVSVQVGVMEKGAEDLMVVDSQGHEVPCYLSDPKRYAIGGLREAEVHFVADLPSMGYEVYYVRTLQHRRPAVEQDNEAMDFVELNTAVLDNGRVRLDIDYFTGVIRSMKLASGKELIDPEHPWGSMIVKEPDAGDFWELNAPLKGGISTPNERSRPILQVPGAEYSKDAGGICGVHQDDVRWVFTVQRKFGKNAYRSTITMYRDMERIDVDGEIINQEEDVRYCAVYPTSMSEQVHCVRGIPFGYTETPQGEYPAVDFFDASDGAKGLTIYNTGHAGNCMLDGVMSLSLLRAVSYKHYSGGGFSEDTDASGGFEKGRTMKFQYAFYLHDGACDTGKALRQGRELNVKPMVYKCDHHKGTLPQRCSFLRVRCPDVLVSCFKPDSEGWILRLYEGGGQDHEDVTVQLGLDVLKAEEVNLVEQAIPAGQIPVENNSFHFSMKKNEVRTFRIYRK